MEIDIPERPNPNIHKYNKEDLETAKRFSSEIQKEMGKFVKAIVLFGSSARESTTAHSDIDVLVLIDDESIVVTKDVADAYRIVIQRIITEVSRRLHVVTLRMSAFWEYMRHGDPIGINILRDGIPLYDTGFFSPMQIILRKGRIRPTQESIWAYFKKAPATLNNARWHIMQAVIDLYWAVIDSAHAALMNNDAVPPTPEHVSDMLDEVLVSKGLLEKKYSRIMKDFYTTAKGIMHREITEIKGSDFEKYFKDASEFVERMERFIKLK
ncbi:hypothetical protein GF323_02745 [Candidatus Woesearchaeota archaeon]|nr:hypothetical protein [Candidatus Woesearchaeota archaeon]